MTRYLIASTLAVTGALGFAQKADAQYSYGYQTFIPGGVYVRSNTFATPFGVQRINKTYSPLTGFGTRQYYYGDVFGNRAAGVNTYYKPRINYGYNPYNRGYNPYYGQRSTFQNNLYGAPNHNRYPTYIRR